MNNTYSLTVTSGDAGYAVAFSVTDSEGNVVDLTQLASATLSYRLFDSPSATPIERTGLSVTDPTNGVVTYYLEAGDFVPSGIYSAFIQLTFNDGSIVGFSNIIITALPQVQPY